MNGHSDQTLGLSDVVLVGHGIMSATLAVLLKELQPNLTVQLFETLGTAAEESSNAWNNAGSGHKWRLVNDQPWRRAYIVFKENVAVTFKPD